MLSPAAKKNVRPPKPRAMNLNVLRAISVVNDWSEAKVKAFLHDNGYPTDGVDAGAVDGASMIKMFFDPQARENFCEPVPDGMGFDPEVFETRFKPQMHELLQMNTASISEL